MFSLLKSELVEITGDSGEKFRLTFTRFSARQSQSSRLYYRVGRQWAAESSGIEPDDYEAIQQLVRDKKPLSDFQDEAHYNLLLGNAWAHIRSGLTKFETWQDGQWVECTVPEELEDPERMYQVIDIETVNRLSDACSRAQAAKILAALDELTKKKDAARTQQSTESLTDSPKPSTTTKRSRARRPKSDLES